MGMKQLPKRSGEYLFEIIMRRYETRSTMMTSNRPLEDWGKLIGDVPSATAILDRFLHHAEMVQMTGRSYRLRDRSGFGRRRRTEDSKPANAPPGSEAESAGFKTSQCAPRLGEVSQRRPIEPSPGSHRTPGDRSNRRTKATTPQDEKESRPTSDTLNRKSSRLKSNRGRETPKSPGWF